MIRFMRYRDHGNKSHGAKCERCEHEEVVRQGLSYSPAQMASLTERGMPVNSMNTAVGFFDGEQNPSFDVSIDRQRGVDICDVWENHMQIRQKARAAAKARNAQKKSSTNAK